MIFPDQKLLYEALEKTWPPADRFLAGACTIRDGRKGGQRVSATTVEAAVSSVDVFNAENAMAALDQPNLFMIRKDDDALDSMLAANGYQIKDPVNLYCCPIDMLTSPPPPRMSAFTIWPPLQIMNDLWAEGGIGPGRLAVMNRAAGQKTAILARQRERAAGTTFVAIHEKIAMLHALEVSPSLRRKGAGINMMRTAATWAQNNGALWFCLMVTDTNTGANALYTKLGMTIVGHYHYRIKQ